MAACAVALLFACVGDEPELRGPSTSPEDDASTRGTQGGDGEAPRQDSGVTTTDAGVGADADAAPLRFCQTEPRPADVADFFCADFDGANVGEGFTEQIVPDGGALGQSADIYFSEPYSLTVKKSAELVWKKVGPLPFSELAMRVRVNVGNLGGSVSPSHTDMRILRLGAPEGAASLDINYTDERVVDGQAHTGYLLQFSACPDACSFLEKRIPTLLPKSVWTDLMVTWTRAGVVTVSYDGTAVLSTNVGLVTSTNVEASIGLVGGANVPFMARHSFDNVIVSVKRQ